MKKIAKVEGKKAVVAAKETPKPEDKKLEVKGPERPKFNPDFCMQEKKIWDSNERFYDANSGECQKACKKDCPQVYKDCLARDQFLAALAKETKTAKKTSSGVRKIKEGGVPPQTKIIDDGLLAKKPKDTIISELATAHYGGDNEVGRSLGGKRFERHLKSIKDGSYVRAAVVAPVISYLDKPAAKK